MAETYELIQSFLVEIRRAGGCRNKTTADRVAPLAEGKANIDWHDPQTRKAHLGELVALAKTALAEAQAPTDPGLKEALSHLAQVIHVDSETTRVSRSSAKGWSRTASSVTPIPRFATAVSG